MILRDDTIEGRNRGAQTGDPQGSEWLSRRREEEPGDILRERNKGNKSRDNRGYAGRKDRNT